VDDLLGAIAGGFEWAYPITKLIMHAEDQLALASNNQTVEKSVVVVEEHYNLGNDLYQLMLDPSMNYTCAYWKDDTKDLAEAQNNKMDLIARKLNLKPGMKVLDIGCGFGAMAKYLAKNYDVSVTCYNISTEQVAYAKENCKGLDVTFIMEDYRNATGQFDRVYSIGFFEAVGVHNFAEYFQVCHRCLKDDGLTLLHTITFNKAHPYPSRNPRWFDKYIFSGGELPFARDYLSYSDDLFVLEDMQSLGKSYRKTLHAWHKNFTAAWDEHLKEKYDAQQGGKFYRMWVFYLLACAGLFECRAIQLDQVVFSKVGRKEEYKSAR
jgi:cyclopropane-fatty-acyl-phospholipid synthase